MHQQEFTKQQAVNKNLGVVHHLLVIVLTVHKKIKKNKQWQ
jgi:hypothetical protein